MLTDCRMRSPRCCRRSYRPCPSMSTHIGGQTHCVRLRWPRPHDTHVHCQQILSLVIHLSLPAKGAINHLLLAIHKRFRRGRQGGGRQGRKATQTQLFQLVFAEEGGLDLFQCLLFSGQMRREGMPQASQTNHDRHQGHHDFYETHTCRGEKGTPPTHACIDPHVLRVSYCCAGRSPRAAPGMPGEKLSEIVTYFSVSKQPGLAKNPGTHPVHAAVLTVEGSHKAVRMWRLSVALP